MKRQTLSFYIAVFLISGIVMALQIMQSRIFSVTSWYHLSFLVISMAMFGLTMGALKVYRMNEDQQRKNYGFIARQHSINFGFFILVALLSQLFIPLFSSNIYLTLVTLPIAAIITSIAYYHAGVAISISLTRSPYPIGRVYGADLLGAGLGCIGALILMETIDTPSGLVFLSGLAFISALFFPVIQDNMTPEQNLTANKNNTIAYIFVIATMIIGGINMTSKSPFLYPLWIKDKYIPMEHIAYEEWNSISRITVMHEQKESAPFLWGASPNLPKNMTSTHQGLIIDGDAGTPITKFDGDLSTLAYLEYDVTNIAYSLPDVNKAVIIGVGGGRDVLSAKYFNVNEVTALDVNPVQIKLLRDHPHYSQYANIKGLPGVKLLNKEARSWFRQNTEKVDLIQMSLIDTWAATGAGAFALSENGLYTVDAWTIFMNDLSENGVFTVSRWSVEAQNDAGRMLSLAMATLFQHGVENVEDHIAIIHASAIASLIISKSPLKQDQLKAIEKMAKEKDFEIIVSPNKTVESGILHVLLQAKNLDELKTIADAQYFDISPSTDMRPFFFNQARFSKPWDIINFAVFNTKKHDSIAHGQAKATFNLFVIIGFSVLMVIFAIIYPLLKTVENKSSTFIKAGTLYFVLIGLGFMLVEISLLQALGVFLGHPIYGLSVVLFSLIISAGLGSLLSDKLPLNKLPSQLLWCVSTCIYGVLMAMMLPKIFTAYAEVEIITRVLISVIVLFPAGLLMGFGFPTGLCLTERHDTRATAWFWGINGAAGVLGSSFAIALCIGLGIDKTLMIGGICYALLFIPFMILAKIPQREQPEHHFKPI